MINKKYKKIVNKYVKCIRKTPLFTVGKRYYVYDKTKNTIKLKNDGGMIEFVSWSNFKACGGV